MKKTKLHSIFRRSIPQKNVWEGGGKSKKNFVSNLQIQKSQLYHIILGRPSDLSNTTFEPTTNSSCTYTGGSQEDRDNASFGRVPYPGGPINVEEIGEDLESDIDLEERDSSDNESIEDDSGKDNAQDLFL